VSQAATHRTVAKLLIDRTSGGFQVVPPIPSTFHHAAQAIVQRPGLAGFGSTIMLEQFRNTRRLLSVVKGGLFSMKKPLKRVLSVYTNSETAIAAQAGQHHVQESLATFAASTSSSKKGKAGSHRSRSSRRRTSDL
jgi:hypothetical protein